MSKDYKVKHVGPSWCMALTILFVALKLTGHIEWSWWLVLSPVWLPAFIVIVFLSVLSGIVWWVGKGN